MVLKDIVELLKNEKLYIENPYNEELIIDDVELIDDITEMNYCKNKLYIIDKVQYINELDFNNVMLITKEKIQAHHMLQIVTKKSVYTVFKIIYKYMLLRGNDDRYKCDIYDSLLSKDINHILDVGEKYLNNPIFISNTNHKVIYESKYSRERKDYTEEYIKESYLLDYIVEIMRASKCIEKIYNFHESFFENSEKNLIYCPINNNNITIGYISILEENKKFAEKDLEITNVLSNAILIEMQRQHLFMNNSGFIEEYYLVDILNNSFKSLEEIKNRVENLDFKMKKNFCIVSIPFKRKYEDFRDNFELIQLIKSFKHMVRNSIATNYEDYIIFLISSDNDFVLSDKQRESITEFLRLNNLKCGCSYTFNNIYESKQFYTQSKYSLELGEKFEEDRYMYWFEDYIEYYLIQKSIQSNGNNKINLSNLVVSSLKRIKDYDSNNNSEFFITLKSYMKNNRNANATASALNIHRSTLFYRFSKIKEILGVDLGDSNNLFKLELAIKISEYINKCLK